MFMNPSIDSSFPLYSIPEYNLTLTGLPMMFDKNWDETLEVPEAVDDIIIYIDLDATLPMAGLDVTNTPI